MFQLDPDEETIYLGRSDNAGRPNELWGFDIDTGTSSVLAVLPDLDTNAGSEAFITGYDSWDSEGNFYISAFSMYDSENAYLIGLNPDEIRSAGPPTTEAASPEMITLAAEIEDRDRQCKSFRRYAFDAPHVQGKAEHRCEFRDRSATRALMAERCLDVDLSAEGDNSGSCQLGTTPIVATS